MRSALLLVAALGLGGCRHADPAPNPRPFTITAKTTDGSPFSRLEHAVVEGLAADLSRSLVGARTAELNRNPLGAPVLVSASRPGYEVTVSVDRAAFHELSRRSHADLKAAMTKSFHDVRLCQCADHDAADKSAAPN